MMPGAPGPRVVLDTQVWLDWLVFDDPGVVALREAHAAGRIDIVIDDACESELVRVLAYDLGRFTLEPEAQARCLARCRRIVTRVTPGACSALPVCSDPDDQKFLHLAAVASASLLVTKDRALLALSGRIPQFRIVSPGECAGI